MTANPTYEQRRGEAGGFTLPEVMMAVFLFGAVMSAALGVFMVAQTEWADTNLELSTDHDASMAMERMIHGPGLNIGLRAAAASSVNVSSGASGWTVVYATPNGVTNTLHYDAPLKRVQYTNNEMSGGTITLGESVIRSSVTNTGSGLHINLTVRHRSGRFTGESDMNTYVAFRN